MISREEQLRSNLTNLQDAIRQKLANLNRLDKVTLIAVTKTWPASDIEILKKLGISDIGESKDQEASAKQELVGSLGLTQHFIGQIQRNKINSILKYSDVLHSVDRAELVSSLAAAALKLNRATQVFLQVNLEDHLNERRGGTNPRQLFELAQQVKAVPLLELKGLMAVAPLDIEPRSAFASFAEVALNFENEFPEANCRSIGMSSDWETALEFGATHLRIGSLLLGNRGQIR
jgi:hypothetical protein